MASHKARMGCYQVAGQHDVPLEALELVDESDVVVVHLVWAALRSLCGFQGVDLILESAGADYNLTGGRMIQSIIESFEFNQSFKPMTICETHVFANPNRAHAKLATFVYRGKQNPSQAREGLSLSLSLADLSSCLTVDIMTRYWLSHPHDNLLF